MWITACGLTVAGAPDEVKEEAKKETVKQEEPKKDTKTLVKEEKAKVKQKLEEYEKMHLQNWNNLATAMQNEKLSEIYVFTDKAIKESDAILKDLSNFQINTTGDVEFDKEANEFKKEIEKAYSQKKDAVVKIKAFLDDPNSEKKANAMITSMNKAAETWQLFLGKAHIITTNE